MPGAILTLLIDGWALRLCARTCAIRSITHRINLSIEWMANETNEWFEFDIFDALRWFDFVELRNMINPINR